MQCLFLRVNIFHLDRKSRKPCVISLSKDRQKEQTMLRRDTTEKYDNLLQQEQEWHSVAGAQD